MSERPVVAIAMSRSVHAMMFADRDLAPLRDAATVLGPVEQATADHVRPLLENATVAVTGWGSPRFDESLLTAAPKLRLIAHSAGSVKGIVTDAVYEHGVRVTTSAAANAPPVAETTVAMMVVMLKRIPWAIHKPWDRPRLQREGPVRELRDLNVGIISASRVGRDVIRMLKIFPRLQVKVYDPYLSGEEADELGVERALLDDVCRCDVVSVHAPAIPATRHILNARTLALLPDHAILINTSRGALIDEAALLAEVNRRPIYVYLDVMDPEPPVPTNPLLTHPNVLVTPHIAGGMNQAQKDMGRLAIEQVLRFLSAEPLEHEVTREMLPTQA